MRKIICLLSLCVCIICQAQIKEHRVSGNKIHQIADGQFELAEKQLGVIGNNYFGEIEIGKCPAERYLSIDDNWFPIDGFKRTAIGMVNSTYTKVEKKFDGDTNFEITIDGGRVGNTELPDIYRFFCEIDVPDRIEPILVKHSVNMPKLNINKICAYGPFVKDVGHDNYFEIHPAEQVWWHEKKSTTDIYHLYSFKDASGWFDERSDFHIDNCSHHPWLKDTMNYVFALPIERRLSKKNNSVISFNIGQINSNCTVPNNNNTRIHTLYFGNELIAMVTEPPGTDFLSISFDNVGLNPNSLLTNDSLIQGFMIIKSKITNKNCSVDGGNVLLQVEKTIRNNPEQQMQMANNEKYKVKVTLDKIKCINGQDGFRDDTEELYGYIGVKAETKDIPALTILPLNSSSTLLWSKLDQNHLRLKTGQSQAINSFLEFSLRMNEDITLIGDIEEDDASWDLNKETSDRGSALKDMAKKFNLSPDFTEDDDALEELCDSENGGYCKNGVAYKPIKISNLNLNQPITRKMYFGSGGTKIEVSFKIELIEKTDAGGPIRTVERAQ